MSKVLSVLLSFLMFPDATYIVNKDQYVMSVESLSTFCQRL